MALRPKIAFDLRTFILIFGAALLGAAWAYYNRTLTAPPYPDRQLRALIWVIFATPFATFWGWFLARRSERWWAAFVCFCVYFFSVFIAARYESCAVAQEGFSLGACFTATSQAQAAAQANGHQIYFASIIILHLLAALVIALQRALSRSTMPAAIPLPNSIDGASV